MKIIIILAFLGILISLGSAMVFLVKPKSENSPTAHKKLVWALTARISISVCLFLLICLAFLMGWIHPTGIPVR